MCLTLYTAEIRLLAALQLQMKSTQKSCAGSLIYPESPGSKLARARIASTTESWAGPARTCLAPIAGLRAGAQAPRPWAGPHRSPVSAVLPASRRPDWPSRDDVTAALAYGGGAGRPAGLGGSGVGEVSRSAEKRRAGGC